MPELTKLDGRTLPIRGGIKKLGTETDIVDYSLRLLEILSVILEPKMDEQCKDVYEQVLKDIMSWDPVVNPGPKKYPNEYLSRILLDNYLHLLKLSSLYFNLSLSSLVTRYLVNLVYDLECWEIYHLLQSIPHLEYFLNLIGFEITVTPFGHIVKPPENYLGFNLRQGLQYTFPFPFYNYSYHSTRPEARLEKYKRVEITPYLDIRLNKSKRGRGRPKAQRFTSAVAERVLENGFLLPFNAKGSKDSDGDAEVAWEELVYDFHTVTPSEIYDQYGRLCSDTESDDEMNTTDGEEHLEKLEDYHSDEEAVKSALYVGRFKYVHSRYTRKQIRKRQNARKKLKVGHSRTKSESLDGGQYTKTASGYEYPTAASQTLPPGYIQKEAPVQLPGTTASQLAASGGYPFAQGAYSKAKTGDESTRQTVYGKERANSTTDKTHPHAAYLFPAEKPSSVQLNQSSLPLLSSHRDGTHLTTKDRTVPDKEIARAQDSQKRKSSMKSADIAKILGTTKQSQQIQNLTPQPKSDAANSMSTPTPVMGPAQSSAEHSRRPLQYAASGYQAQMPMRAMDHETQGAHTQTGQPVAQIVTLPTYQYAAYNPYAAWIAPQAHAIDKLQEAKHTAEQQSLIMAAYQKYGYPEAYNPYIAGYPSTYAAPMYQRPEQIYYAQGAPNIAYAPPGSSAYAQQYPYMGAMYAPHYSQQMHSPPSVGKSMAQPPNQKRASSSSSNAPPRKMSTKDKISSKKGGMGEHDGA